MSNLRSRTNSRRLSNQQNSEFETLTPVNGIARFETEPGLMNTSLPSTSRLKADEEICAKPLPRKSPKRSKKANANQRSPESRTSSNDADTSHEYVPERILSHKYIDSRKYVRVQWNGIALATWEEASSFFVKFPDMKHREMEILDFRERNGRRRYKMRYSTHPEKADAWLWASQVQNKNLIDAFVKSAKNEEMRERKDSLSSSDNQPVTEAETTNLKKRPAIEDKRLTKKLAREGSELDSEEENKSVASSEPSAVVIPPKPVQLLISDETEPEPSTSAKPSPLESVTTAGDQLSAGRTDPMPEKVFPCQIHEDGSVEVVKDLEPTTAEDQPPSSDSDKPESIASLDTLGETHSDDDMKTGIEPMATSPQPHSQATQKAARPSSVKATVIPLKKATPDPASPSSSACSLEIRPNPLGEILNLVPLTVLSKISASFPPPLNENASPIPLKLRKPAEKLGPLPPPEKKSLVDMTVDDLRSFLTRSDLGPIAEMLYAQSFDGKALLNIQDTKSFHSLGIPIGPSVKLNKLVQDSRRGKPITVAWYRPNGRLIEKQPNLV